MEFDYIKIPKNRLLSADTCIDTYTNRGARTTLEICGKPIFCNENEDKKNEDKKENKKRKENNKTMRLLEIYKNKQEEEIKLRYKKQEEDILEKDELVAIAEEYNAKLKFLIADEEKIEKISLIKDRVITEYSKKAIKLLAEQKNKELEGLYQFIDIIEAQLEIAETYEQKQEILRTYKILNDDNSFSKLNNKNKDEEEIIQKIEEVERKVKKARKEY